MLNRILALLDPEKLTGPDQNFYQLFQQFLKRTRLHHTHQYNGFLSYVFTTHRITEWFGPTPQDFIVRTHLYSKQFKVYKDRGTYTIMAIVFHLCEIVEDRDDHWLMRGRST